MLHSPCGMASGGQVDFKRRSRVLVLRWENREPLLSSSTRIRFSKEVYGCAKNLGVSQKHWWNFVKLCSRHDKNSALLSKAPPLNKNALEISLRHFYQTAVPRHFSTKREKNCANLWNWDKNLILFYSFIPFHSYLEVYQKRVSWSRLGNFNGHTIRAVAYRLP